MCYAMEYACVEVSVDGTCSDDEDSDLSSLDGFICDESVQSGHSVTPKRPVTPRRRRRPRMLYSDSETEPDVRRQRRESSSELPASSADDAEDMSQDPTSEDDLLYLQSTPVSTPMEEMHQGVPDMSAINPQRTSFVPSELERYDGMGTYRSGQSRTTSLRRLWLLQDQPPSELLRDMDRLASASLADLARIKVPHPSRGAAP